MPSPLRQPTEPAQDRITIWTATNHNAGAPQISPRDPRPGSSSRRSLLFQAALRSGSLPGLLSFSLSLAPVMETRPRAVVRMHATCTYTEKLDFEKSPKAYPKIVPLSTYVYLIGTYKDINLNGKDINSSFPSSRRVARYKTSYKK